MSSRPARASTVAAGVLLSLAVTVLAWRSVLRVPEGSMAASGGRLYASGWHVRGPWRTARVVPVKGRLQSIDVDRRAEDGTLVRVRLSFDYELVPDALRTHAAALDDAGPSGVALSAARAALEPLPLAALVADGPAGGGASLPAPARLAVARALRAAGLEPIDLQARIGPADAFAPDLAPGSAVLVASPGGPGGPAPMPRRDPTGVRLLLIGLDGADWDIIEPLARAGRLPNLARLMNEGTRAPLRSYDPMISPLLWTTMVTGVGPDRHGVADFQAIDAASGRRVPISSRFRRVKALWNILTDAGLETAFVAWWASYPAEATNGVQVSNLVAFEALRPAPAGIAAPAGITYPHDYFNRIRPALITASGLVYDQVRRVLRVSREEFEAARQEVLRAPGGDRDAEPRRLAQKPLPLALSILAGSRNYAAIAADLAARRPDLTGVYFEGIDMMGHRFQHCMPPRLALCPDGDFTRFRDAVAAFYEIQDAWIGEVLRAAGPGTTVMVVSDHGFKSGAGRPAGLLPYTTQQPVEWHDEEGIFILSGPAARRGARMAERPTLFDIAPTILHLLGLPVAEDMPGRVVLEAIDPIFAAAHPVRTVRSYEPLGPPLARAAAAGVEDGGASRAAQEELLANLGALGYLGGGSQSDAPPEPPAPGGAGGQPGPTEGAAGTQVFYHRNLATYFLKRNEYARAAEQLRLANDRQRLPKNYQMLSEAYLGMGRRREAIAALREGLRTIEESDPEPVLWLVQIHLDGPGGRAAALDEAERFKARTVAKPGLADAIAALLAEDAGDRDAAAGLYRRSLAADPLRVLAARRLYDLEAPAGRAAALEPKLRLALARDPRIDEYHNLLGAILAETGRAAEALDAFRRAAAIDPDNPRFAGNLASALARLERWEEAALAYERAAALAPSAATSMKLGSVYRRLAEPARALAAFERARALGESGPGPLLGMALARASMDQIPEALAMVREGLRLHPEDPALRSLQGDLMGRTR